MKVAALHNIIESNINSGTEFTIKASPKAFQILSEGLYSDKVAAFIRELSTNAYDAHVCNNKKSVPFRVVLPNQFNSNFIVRDYGEGLSEEHMVELYTTYFSSSKTSSNDYIGSFGLGSKSPFSYTNTFTVKSYYNGVCYAYIFYINDEGFPVKSKLSVGETSEPSGLEVIVPIKQNDFSKVRDKARDVYQWFDVRPLTNIELDYSTEDERLIYSNQLYSLYENHSYQSAEFYARYGQVLYKIPGEYIVGDAKGIKAKCVINFDIGTLEVTPSRETLSYTKRTINKINNKIVEVVSDIPNSLSSELDVYDTIYDAYIKSLDYGTRVSRSSVKYYYKGTVLPDKLFYNLESTDFRFKYRIDYGKKYATAKRYSDLGEKLAFIFKDKSVRYSFIKLQEYVKDTYGSEYKVILVESEHKDKFTSSTEVQYIKDISFNTDKFKYINVSEINIEYEKKVRLPAKKIFPVEVLCKNGFETGNYNISEITGYYLPTKARLIQLLGKDFGSDYVFSLVYNLQRFGILDENIPVYKIKSTLVSKASNLVSLESVLSKILLNEDYYNRVIKNHAYYQAFTDKYYVFVSGLKDHYNTLVKSLGLSYDNHIKYEYKLLKELVYDQTVANVGHVYYKEAIEYIDQLLLRCPLLGSTAGDTYKDHLENYLKG